MPAATKGEEGGGGGGGRKGAEGEGKNRGGKEKKGPGKGRRQRNQKEKELVCLPKVCNLSMRKGLKLIVSFRSGQLVAARMKIQ